MKEHCFSIAIEAPNNQNDMLVHGRLVRALHDAGFKYQSTKPIPATEHWARNGKSCSDCANKHVVCSLGYTVDNKKCHHRESL